MPTHPAPRIFVSHSHKDEDVTQRLVTDLHRAGADVWVDVAGITHGNFVQRIDEALQTCEWMVLVLTPNAVSSHYVKDEVYTALHRVTQGYMRDVIPVLATNCAPGTIPPQWDVLHRYDATHGYDQALAGVLRAVGLAAPVPSTPAAPPAMNSVPPPHMRAPIGAIPPLPQLAQLMPQTGPQTGATPKVRRSWRPSYPWIALLAGVVLGTNLVTRALAHVVSCYPDIFSGCIDSDTPALIFAILVDGSFFLCVGTVAAVVLKAARLKRWEWVVAPSAFTLLLVPTTLIGHISLNLQDPANVFSLSNQFFRDSISRPAILLVATAALVLYFGLFGATSIPLDQPLQATKRIRSRILIELSYLPILIGVCLLLGFFTSLTLGAWWIAIFVATGIVFYQFCWAAAVTLAAQSKRWAWLFATAVPLVLAASLGVVAPFNLYSRNFGLVFVGLFAASLVAVLCFALFGLAPRKQTL